MFATSKAGTESAFSGSVGSAIFPVDREEAAFGVAAAFVFGKVQNSAAVLRDNKFGADVAVFEAAKERLGWLEQRFGFGGLEIEYSDGASFISTDEEQVAFVRSEGAESEVEFRC
jgi:hypothetical protein